MKEYTSNLIVDIYRQDCQLDVTLPYGSYRIFRNLDTDRWEIFNTVRCLHYLKTFSTMEDALNQILGIHPYYQTRGRKRGKEKSSDRAIPTQPMNDESHATSSSFGGFS